jgi:hypothetical protein
MKGQFTLGQSLVTGFRLSTKVEYRSWTKTGLAMAESEMAESEMAESASELTSTAKEVAQIYAPHINSGQFITADVRRHS